MATTSVPRDPLPGRDPFPAGMQKIAAASGIAFGLLLILTILVGGDTTPDRDAPLTEWTEYARDNEADLRIASLLFGLATIEFLWFIGVLRGALGIAEQAARGFTRISHIVFGAGIAAITSMAVGIFISAAAVSYADTPPETLRALSQLGGAGFTVATAGFSAMLFAVGLFNSRVPTLPSWLGWLALVNGITFLLTFGTLLSDEYDNAFGMFYPISFLLLVVFSIGASVTFIQRVGSPGRAGSPSASEL